MPKKKKKGCQDSATSFTVFNSAFLKPKMEKALINTEVPVSDLPRTNFNKLHFMLQSKHWAATVIINRAAFS